MVTIVIKNNGEDNVVQLTYQNLWREIKDIPDAELIVSENWFDYVGKTKNNYMCFVEADCLVNSGYFSSQVGLFKKNPMFRKLAMLSSAVGVNTWSNKFYGYKINQAWSDKETVDDKQIQTKNTFIEPSRDKKSRAVYPVEIGYVPGAIIRSSMLQQALGDVGYPNTEDLIHLSEQLSLAFWKQGDGNRVHINPNTTYVTTEEYVNDTAQLHTELGNLSEMFKKESI